MKPIFVDTSAFIALGNSRDHFHLQAKELKRTLIESQRTFVTTSLIIVEFCSAFSNLLFRSTAIDFVESIANSRQWECLEVDQILRQRGFELFKQMSDKEWSLVDCISIIVARDIGVTQIFTNDHHFEQAGFQILLQKSVL
jgi:predicted nucleic acid-binding protein